MSVLSTPIKYDIAMQKDIFRFAATLFAQTSNEYSALESQLQMIKCVFAKQNNEPMTVEEISVQLLDMYKYHVSNDEIIIAIKNHKKTFQSVVVDDEEAYKLLEHIYQETIELQNDNIDSYIDKYIKTHNIINAEVCSNAIYKYLYELTTTNINTYKVLMCGKSGLKFTDKELSVDISDFSTEEQKYVYDFIAWEDADKNISLSNIVFSCLEYCLLVNGDKPNKLLANSIRKREIYLDTNIIFRALGINGPIRERTVLSFLKKCKQAKLKLIISHTTNKEFFDTIEHYINQIILYPSGNVYSGAYEQISDYSIFSFYDNWRKEHPKMSIMYFKMYIKSLYAKLVNEYNIADDKKIPKEIYDSDKFKVVRNAYSLSIKQLKEDMHDKYVSEDDRYSLKDSHDATVVHYVELQRKENEEADVFFVSSDKLLRYWDMSRNEKEYPIVIYPSQLFLVLIKTCGRSDNDFDSFVSFINVRPSHHQISAEKANVIISAIGTITEDIKTQKLLVSAICDGEYQNIINSKDNDRLLEEVQALCKKYLEKELEEKSYEIDALHSVAEQSATKIAELKEVNASQEEEIILLKEKIIENEKTIDTSQKSIHKQKKISETQKQQICDFAEKKTKLGFVIKWYIIPAVIILLFILFIIFLVLQFVCCDAKWNFATKIIDAIGTTTFGKNVEGYVAVIDGGLFTFLTVVVIPQFWVKPWDAEKRELDKQKKIENYITKNKLL